MTAVATVTEATVVVVSRPVLGARALRTVVQMTAGGIRLLRTRSWHEAHRVREAWARGDFSTWPGEFRPTAGGMS